MAPFSHANGAPLIRELRSADILIQGLASIGLLNITESASCFLSDIVVQLVVVKVKIRKNDLVWDEWNIEHIAKHNVTRAEVEEIFARAVRAKKIYKGRLIVFGKTRERRLLVVILEKEERGYYVLSSRNASRKEREDLLK